MGIPPILAPPVEVTLSLFGGMDTEISPSDVPEGLSPDTQDGIYTPGNWQTRPGLHKLFNPTLGAVEIVYAKSYVQPNGKPLTVLLTSDGKLWVEDITNSPGIGSAVGQVPPGLSAQSVTAFGREYIAISDLLHGAGVPLQFDGTHLDRVTQDGPGAPPTLTNYLPPAVALQGSGAGAPVNGSNAEVSDPYTVDPPTGGGGGGVECFSGNTRLNGPTHPLTFLAARAIYRDMGVLWLRDGAGNLGEYDLIVHEAAPRVLLDMGEGELVTLEHLMRWSAGEPWQAAAKCFTQSTAYEGEVFNLHRRTLEADEQHYGLANGWTAHNNKAAPELP